MSTKTQNARLKCSYFNNRKGYNVKSEKDYELADTVLFWVFVVAIIVIWMTI